MIKHIAVALALTFAFPSLAFAAAAEMILSPTRLVMEGKDRFATVSVKNPGDAIGRYRVELIDTVMLRDGTVKMLNEDEEAPYSALGMLRASPRSITLKPGEFQTVRLLVKKPKDLEAGEYRSHLKVRMTESNIDPKTGKAVVDAEGISVKAKLVMIIPIITRHGETSFESSISDVKWVKKNADNPDNTLNVTLNVTGNQSVIGDFVVYHVKGGSEKQLTNFSGVAVYRGTAERVVKIPLKSIPSDGTLKVVYQSQDDDGNGNAPILASYEMSL